MAGYAFWWLHAQINACPAGARLAIALPRAAVVHWGSGGWRNAADETTRDSGLSFHVAALDATGLAPGERIEFTWQWQDTGAWHERTYEVAVVLAEDNSTGR